MNTEIRWRQRFSPYRKALLLLEQAVKLETFSELEQDGLLHRMKCAFDLGWMTLRDFLKAKGFENLIGPKSVLQQAFQEGLIADGSAWGKMLESCNRAAHTYNEETALQIAQDVREKYYFLLHALAERLTQEMENG